MNIDTIKEVVKSHRVVPFNINDVTCTDTILSVKGEYKTSNIQAIMNNFGIRKTLSQDILRRPTENWNAIRSAIVDVAGQKKFGCIVDKEGRIVTLVNTNIQEAVQLDFDQRIDSLFDAIDKSGNESRRVLFNSELAQVEIGTVSKSIVECGAGDDWEFGTQVNIGYGSQTFANYYNRLICTNGMSTRENIAYRMALASSNIGKQYTRYSANNEFSQVIKSRVDEMRNCKASYREAAAVAHGLTDDMRAELLPWFDDMESDYLHRGYNLSELPKQQHKLVSTNESLYDVFNVGTFAASHRREALEHTNVMQLNKTAGEMFTNGPDLKFELINIYN